MSEPVQSLFHRSTQERAREYKYRCAQSIIFGLPVLALQWFGPRLAGGPQESQRWIGLLQALLAGWVTYVAAAGMLVEGLMLIGGSRRMTVDLLVAGLAVALYLFSAISVLGVFVRGVPFYGPLMFHCAVIILAVWTGWRWWRTARSVG
ncbi:MAG TPA: hypothetical protein VH518_23355 [Tepidisphaeraceae bacterium]|jgi:cation transport ATPase